LIGLLGGPPLYCPFPGGGRTPAGGELPYLPLGGPPYLPFGLPLYGGLFPYPY